MTHRPEFVRAARAALTLGALWINVHPSAVLVVAFFLFIYTVVAPHVPSNSKNMVLLWGGLTAACMTGVFWLCIQMFRVVLRAQRAAQRK